MRIIKESNYGNKRGLLDPAVFERTKNKHIYYDNCLKEPVKLSEIDFMAIRNGMGSQNRSLTTKKIFTKNILIPCNDHYLTAQLSQVADQKNIQHCCVYLHGGGFMGGSAQKLQNQSELLAQFSKSLVISLNYRLAPETIFPGAIEDVIAAISWICDHHRELGFSDERVFVMGDSAGGNLAVIAGKQLTKKYINQIVTLYGAFDLSPTDHSICHWSYKFYQIDPQHHTLIHSRINKIGYLNDLVRQLYVTKKAAVSDPYVSPITGTYDQSFPEITMIEAEYDYCLPSNEYLAQVLQNKGVKVNQILYLGLDHGFYDRLGYLKQTQDCIETMANIINKN